jgi:hypothetical protein
LAFDAMEETFRNYRIRRDPGCPACSVPAETLVIAEYDEHCAPHRAH